MDVCVKAAETETQSVKSWLANQSLTSDSRAVTSRSSRHKVVKTEEGQGRWGEKEDITQIKEGINKWDFVAIIDPKSDKERQERI